MKKFLSLIFILLAFFASTSSMAAEKLDFATVDLLTYRCFQAKNWDSVILVGKQALRQDIDYYYLRVRMGIAYYEKNDYFAASAHLKKARQFNTADPAIANYLYWACIYSNKEEEAAMVKPFMTGEARNLAGNQNGILQEMHVEGGYTLSSDANPKNLGTMMEKDSIYGERDLYGNSYYSNLSMKLRVSNRISLTLAYNYLNFAKTKYIQYGHSEAHRDSISEQFFTRDYFYSFPWKIHDTAFRYNVSQHEAYIGVAVALPWGLKITPAFHWIHDSYRMTTPVKSSDSLTDTAYYSRIDNTYHLFRYPSVTYTYNSADTSFSNYVASLQISKDIGRFNIAITGSWSNLNGKKQKQAGLLLTCYPFGNLNLYETTMATFFKQGKDSRLLFSQVVGAKITPWMWGEANFYYGDYTNANIFNGSIVYNNSDIINYRGGATLFFVVGKHLRFSLIYQYMSKEGQQIYYIKTQDPVTYEIKEVQKTKNNPYNTNTLIGGITWKL